MALVEDLQTVLAPALAGGAYPDQADGIKPRPYGIFQQIGGGELSNMSGRVTNVANPHYQVVVFGDTRLQCDAAALAVKQAMNNASAFTAVPEGEFASREPDTGFYSKTLGFSIWGGPA
jgi:hypothetical protein